MVNAITLDGRSSNTCEVSSYYDSIIYMQSTRVPKGILDEVERLCRNFLWGHPDERRGLHLVNWKGVSQSLQCGGLGIRNLRAFNDRGK